jgi:hypothetical protein
VCVCVCVCVCVGYMGPGTYLTVVKDKLKETRGLTQLCD